MFNFLSKLSFNRGTNIGFIIFGSILAPYWWLFQFADKIYKHNSIVQTLILALAIGAPVCIIVLVINLKLSSTHVNSDKSEQEKIERTFSIIGLSCVFCGFVFYATCCLKFFIPNLSQKSAIELISFAFIVFISSVVVDIILPSKKVK